jgi:alpha-tubulin suppressor-like RCC1 family protein
LAVGTTNGAYGDNPNEMGANLPWTNLHYEPLFQIATGYSKSCARVPSASLGVFQVKCWGWGGDGSLGQGNSMTLGNSPTTVGAFVPPINLGTGRSVMQVTTGYAHTCALLDDATVKCWGSNAAGQLGLGDTLTRGDGTMPMGDALPALDL